MDVDGAARHRPVVAEHFHAVDQGDDAVGLVADQPGQHAVFGRGRLLEQLRGAANAGQRVLDLMRQHRGQRDHRARRASMRQLPVHLVGDGALLQHHDDVAGPFGERGDMQIDLAVAADAGRTEIDLVFVDRRAARAHLVDQRQQRTAERHQLFQGLPAQELRRDFEEGFGSDIGVDNAAVGRNQQHRIGQRVEDGLALGGNGAAIFCGGAHAAALHEKSSNASCSDRCTRCGSSDVKIFCRQPFSVSAGARLYWAAISSAQPRCFRACFSPIRRP